MNRLREWTLLLGMLLAVSTTGGVPASAESTDREWNFGVEIYLWGAGIGGTTTVGDNIDISFDDLLSNLEMAFMGTFAAGRGRWHAFADLIYLDVSDSVTMTGRLIFRPATLRTELEMKSFISTLGGAYKMVDGETWDFALVGGARYLDLETDLTFTTGRGRGQRVSASDSVWDGVVGLRGRADLSPDWYLTYYADIGTGDSDRTWQLLADVNYRFGKVDAVVGYRHLAWKFQDKKVFESLDIHGPYAGVKFSF